ncbi:MAG: PEP-CTERM sorting domain-containing protein [Acidobacteria bacterium]|nr:PEP-CTERM sorting domain-containing protein [Acidobacteriota bacterium]
MRRTKTILLSLFGLAVFALTPPAGATILTFSITDVGNYPVSEDFPEGFGIDQTYGDNVTSTSTTNGTVTFGYGVGAEGFTPNVQVSYGPFSIFTGGASLWRYNYGDLDRVLYQGSTAQPVGNNYNYLLVDLIADPGFEVVLYGFDLGGWNETDYVIDSVSVYDAQFNGFFPAQNRVLYDQNATILGNGPTHSAYSFGTPIRGNWISILIDANNLGDTSELIGIDNIRFGQDIDTTPDVPEPGTISMVLLAGCGLWIMRRR